MMASCSIKNRPNKIMLIFARDGGHCWICDEAINFGLPIDHDEAATLDHFVPRRFGGPNAWDNLRLAHRICNEARGRFHERLFFDDATARWAA